MSDNTVNENPIFICGHRKTGTTLMACLLDNHPQLAVIPTDSGFFYTYYPLCEQMDWTAEEKKKRIIEYSIRPTYDILVKKCGMASYYAYALTQNIETHFSDRFYYCDNRRPEELLTILARAYNTAHGQKQKNYKYWVEKTTSSEIYAGDIKGWFPKAKFIHIVRDPRDNWASLKSGWGKKYSRHNDDIRRLMQSHIERGVLGMRLALDNQSIYKEDYFIVKYEELVKETKNTMMGIAQWLGIDYDDCLLKPTMFGYDWKGNNFSKEWQGVSGESIGRWAKELDNEEVDLIEYYYFDLMECFNYNKINYSGRRDMYDAVRNQYAWHNFAQTYSVDKEKYNE